MIYLIKILLKAIRYKIFKRNKLTLKENEEAYVIPIKVPLFGYMWFDLHREIFVDGISIPNIQTETTSTILENGTILKSRPEKEMSFVLPKSVHQSVAPITIKAADKKEQNNETL